jgi:lysozyme family protein
MTAFDTCFASVIHSEGGFSNNPRDPGGITNLGVTKRAWEAWVGHSVTEQDMRQLTPAIVAPFYRANYWNAVHGDSFPVGIALCLFHCAVNAGPKRAATLLQGIVGAVPDGAIGAGTQAAVRAFLSARGEQALVAAFQDALRAYYRSLSTFEVFGRGWLNRARDVEQQALALVA